MINFVEVYLVIEGKHEDVLAKPLNLHWIRWLPSFLRDFFYHTEADVFGGEKFG